MNEENEILFNIFKKSCLDRGIKYTLENCGRNDIDWDFIYNELYRFYLSYFNKNTIKKNFQSFSENAIDNTEFLLNYFITTEEYEKCAKLKEIILNEKMYV